MARETRKANHDAMLRDAGLRVTQSRLAVLELLSKRAAPMSHGEVAEALGARGVDRATVFRNLRDLVESELIVRIDFGDRLWRYQYRRRDDVHQHPHFVCTECGEIECLSELQVSFDNRRHAPTAVKTGEVSVHIKGRCDDCAPAGDHGTSR